MPIPNILQVFRDWVVDGVPSSGAHDPDKSDIRAWGNWVEAIINAFVSGNGFIYASRAALYADLSKAANSLAWVMGDATAAYNGIYRKNGAAGSGSWTLAGPLPYSFITAADIGDGTPNAIKASSQIPVSEAALVVFSVFEANTGSPVTVSFNSGPALTIKTNTGNNVPAGGLTAGMRLLGTVSGSTFRLVNDQVSSAIVAAAEAAAANAETARAAAAAAAAGVNMPLVYPTDAGKVLSVKADGSGFQALDVQTALPDLSPVYLDQLITGFHGRGMLAAEALSIATEVAITATSADGTNTITVASGTNFLAGTNVTVKHDNGRYWSYWVQAKSGNVLTISPNLRWPVSSAGGARAERTWYNRAHAGKFYMRQLAQRIASFEEKDVVLPTRDRAFFTQFLNNGSAANDQMTAVGAGAVSYFAASSSNTADVNMPVRFGTRATALVTVSGVGDGAKSNAFTVVPASTYMLRMIVKTSAAAVQALARVMAVGSPDVEIASRYLPSDNDAVVERLISIPFRVPKGVTSIRVQVENAAAAAGSIAVNMIEVFPIGRISRGNMFKDFPKARIVVCGDSWAAGDPVTSPERESFATQLGLELPFATIINKGIGGSKIWEWLPSFSTYIAVEKPDVVIMHTGVNECYAPSSGVFNPNHVQFFQQQVALFVSNCLAIGARPVIIGTPALAEADSSSGFTAWTLNDRATLQAAYLYENL